MDIGSEISQLGRELRREHVDPITDVANLQLRQAEISAIDWTAFRVTLTKLGGSSGTTPNIAFKSPYIPSVGDSVWVAKIGELLIVLGTVGSTAPKWPNTYAVTVAGSNPQSTTNSLIFINWPSSTPVSFNWRKFYDSTQLLVELVLGGYSIDGGEYTVGYRIAGVDRVVGSFYFNVTGTHLQFTHHHRLAGIAKGLHSVTFRLQSKGGTITTDQNDQVSLKITEINPTTT